MHRLSLIRYEYEPVRESYSRRMAYNISRGRLYYARLADGRTNDHIIERSLLAPAALAEITQHLYSPGFQQDCNIRQPDTVNDLHLYYDLTAEFDGQLLFQKYSAPQPVIFQSYQHINDLWRLLAGYTGSEAIEMVPLNPAPAVVKFFQLIFRDLKNAKDVTPRVRRYIFSGKRLIFEENNDASRKILLTAAQLHKIQYFLGQEKAHLQAARGSDLKKRLAGKLYEIDFAANYGDMDIFIKLRERRLWLADHLVFPILALLEEQLKGYLNDTSL